MKVTRALFVAAFAACSLFANATSMVSVECTQVTASSFHINCTAPQGQVADVLINYDVKNNEGKTLASGYGSEVAFDETKLAKGEEYSITVYALVNGNVESQVLTRHAGTK